MSSRLSPSELLERARRDGNPVILDGTATFLWQGDPAPALVSDLDDWEEHPRPLKRLAPGLYAISLDLPSEAYLEYSFLDPATKQRLADPLNPHTTWDGLGHYNHYFYMPGGGPDPLTGLAAGIARGALTRHQVPTNDMAAGRQRSVTLYRPPAKGPVPLLVVLDGSDYLRRGRLPVIVDNLIAQKRIPPIAMAFVPNGRQARSIEYTCSESTLGFLVQAVVPLARRELRLLDPAKAPGAYGILGASLGGLMAVYAALRAPGIFGRAISQAGAFELGDYETVTMDLVRHAPKPPVKLWLDAGRMDFLLAANRRMSALLREKGYDLTYVETPGAHNYTTWRNVLGRALETVFTG